MHLLLFALAQALPVQNFPPVDHPGVDPNLAASIAADCSAATADRGQLLRQADRYADSLRGRERDAALWFGAACVRANLIATGALSHEGIEMPLGTSWEEGAVNALLRSLALRPGDRRAADLLAILALDNLGADVPARIRTALDRARAAGVATAATYRACSEFAWRAHDTTATSECATASLAHGLDSTWQLIRLARLRFGAADTVGGSTLFQAAAVAARDSASKLEMTWHLQWFLTPAEQQEWQEVADSGIGRWIRNRLASRDVRDGRPQGARLAEHFARLEYVETYFRIQVPRRIAAALRSGPAEQESPGLCPSPTSCGEPGGVWAIMWREYRRWQTDFDDRGVVWMRFGAPDRRVPWVCACATVREAWIYDLDDRHMLLSFENEAFDGSVEATRLVSGVLGSYFCDIDSRRCALSTLSQADANARSGKNSTAPASAMVAPEDIEHLRVQDREAIAAATTADDNSPRGERFIETVGRLHRLWNPETGEPVALVTYAVRNSDLNVGGTVDRREADLVLTVRQWDPAVGARRDTTLHLHNTFDGGKLPRDWTGFVVLPSTRAIAAWSVMVTQSDRRLGRAFEDPGVPLSQGSVALSDLVIGAAGENLRWVTGGNAILLAPFNTVDRSAPMQLYYQVRSNSSAAARTVLALYRTDIPGRTDTPALEIGFASELRPGVSEVAPDVDLSRLDKGEYRIELRIEDEGGRVLVRRTATVTLR